MSFDFLDPGAAAPIPDTEYFFDDGDCMFLVQSSLFKLHKSFLSRGPESMFRDMFSIPQGSSTTQSVELAPIRLTGDSKEEFRALCWVIYALPNEIYLQSTSKADVERLAKAVKMFHKYSLPAFETWGLEMIRKQCGPELDYLINCSPPMLYTLMALALQSSDSQLLSIVEEKWMARIRLGLPCNTALTAGERHGRRQFLAEVYQYLNKELYVTVLSPANAFSHLHLTDTHLLRLLSGYTLLSNFWFHLRRAQLSPRDGCTQHYQCTSVWNDIQWTAQDGSNVLESLVAVRTFVCARYGGKNRCPEKYIDQVIADFHLVDFFFPPEATGGGQH
ncbi:hypothetical protein FB451DRAFT_621530 [Mycena latifolia]|nr:hypothetical protein FB451DRAFT_621530 [Mycena latifolia]